MAENSKPFDQAFKSLPEASPRGFLEVMGVLPRDIDAEVELLPQELSASTVSLDTGIIARPRNAEPFVAIFESFAVYQSRSLEQVLEYGKRIDSKSPLRQRIFMVPLVERARPADPPRRSFRRKGDFRVGVNLNWILPWEIDASIFLAQQMPEFDAWTVLCQTTPEQQDEVIRRLGPVPNHLARYKTLGGLRYRGKEAALWRAFAERIDQMITKDDLRESLAVQEWLEEGRQEGLQKGLQEGRRETSEEFLRAVVRRFPAIQLPEVLPATIDLTALAKDLALAPDEKSARVALASCGIVP